MNSDLRPARLLPSSRRIRAAENLRLKWIGPILLALVAGWISCAGANPLPSTYIGVAVREPAGEFCAGWPFGPGCAGITDVTPLTGRLEFDFYRWSAFPPDSILWQDVCWRMYWPEEWSFVSASVCGGWVVEQSGNEVVLQMPDLSQAPGVSPYFFGLASVVLDVTSRGRLQSQFVSGYIGQGTVYEPDWNGSAEAGYPCGGCADRTCGGGWGLDPVFVPSSLGVEIPSGSSREVIVQVFDEFGDEELAFSSSVPWMTVLHVDHPDSYEYIVTFEISAQGLLPGEYEGLMLADASTCVECGQVRLTVLEPSGTEDGTWGALKRRFVRESR